MKDVRESRLVGRVPNSYKLLIQSFVPWILHGGIMGFKTLNKYLLHNLQIENDITSNT